MTKVSKVWDGTDPGATPGRVFTASIGQETIIQNGKELSYLKLGMKGAVSTAAVAVETFAGLLSEYVLRIGAQERIVMNMQDLCALMVFYYGQLPVIGENTDATGNDYIGGVKVPVYSPVDNNTPVTHAATFATQTNIGTGTLAVSAYWDTGETNRKPIHAIKISHTTAGSAGIETLGFRIAPVGKLIGLMIKQANDFDDGNIDVSVQRVRLLEDGQVHSQFNCLTDRMAFQNIDFVTPNPLADLIRTYTMLDLRPSGIDAKAKEITIQIDVEDVSDAISIIPILEM